MIEPFTLEQLNGLRLLGDKDVRESRSVESKNKSHYFMNPSYYRYKINLTEPHAIYICLLKSSFVIFHIFLYTSAHWEGGKTNEKP